MAKRMRWLLAGMLLLWTGPALALPELTIGLLWGTEENDNCVTQVHYILQILNFGDEPSGPFTMHVVFDAPELPPIEDLGLYKGISHLVEESIEPNGMFQVELWWKEEGGVPEGDWTSWMYIDLNDDVAEIDEDNNSEGPIYLHTETIMCEPPNLFIQDLLATVEGTEITLTATAGNIDVIDVPDAFRLDIYQHRDGQPGYYDAGDAFAEFEGIKKGETVSLQHVWDPGEDGVYMAYAVVDVWNTIFETSEADNIIGPIPVVVCTDCPDCEDGVAVVGPCKCGGEPVGTGYCCQGVHVEMDCASLVEEASPEWVERVEAGGEEVGQDVVSESDAPQFEVISQDVPADLRAGDSAVSTDVTPTSKKKSSGCHAGTRGATAGVWLLLLALVVLASRRRVT
jgi:hypothetical protein